MIQTTELDDPGSYARVIRDARGGSSGWPRAATRRSRRDPRGRDQLYRLPREDAVRRAPAGRAARTASASTTCNRRVPLILRTRATASPPSWSTTAARSARTPAPTWPASSASCATASTPPHGQRGDVRRPGHDLHRADVRSGRTPGPSDDVPGGRHADRARAEIGPSARLVDSRSGTGAACSSRWRNLAVLGEDVNVGPFASLRPGTVLGRVSKAGQLRRDQGLAVGEGSKVPHLSYVGDADIGEGVNIGAATITVNYDGSGKHRTVIGDDVEDRLGYDARGAGRDRRRGDDGGRFGDHEGRAAGRARGRARRSSATSKASANARTLSTAPGQRRSAAAAGRRLTRGAGRGDHHQEAHHAVRGHLHPDLAHEIAEDLGIPISPCEIRRFASGEIYVRPEDSVRGADVFIIQTHTRR